MDARSRESADWVRALIEQGLLDRSAFQGALLQVPPPERDAWLDRAFGIDPLPIDGADLPRGCVPYLPCSVDALLRVVEHAPVRASDVFVDVGAGIGRAAALVHLVTGAEAIGIEVQRGLVRAARDLAARLSGSRLAYVEGDVEELPGLMTVGTVFFLYCPFSGERLARWLASLEPVARTRMIRVCCVDVPLPPCSWLDLEPPLSTDLSIYRSTLHHERVAPPQC